MIIGFDCILLIKEKEMVKENWSYSTTLVQNQSRLSKTAPDLLFLVDYFLFVFIYVCSSYPFLLLFFAACFTVQAVFIDYLFFVTFSTFFSVLALRIYIKYGISQELFWKIQYLAWCVILERCSFQWYTGQSLIRINVSNRC